ncbi:hypothetical protein B0A55_10954, partial [Friedmanniomyces simplex]
MVGLAMLRHCMQAKALFDQSETMAKQMGLYNEYLCLNYAAPWPDPISGYGAAVKAQLQAVSKMYDPRGVFQTQCRSALTLLSHLSAYSLAGCLMEHFVVFHSWQLTTSPDELQRLQTPTGMRTLYIYVIPKMITTLLACYLAWTTNQTWLKWCVACLTVSWVSSFTVQIPLQRRIQQTGDSKALVTLVWTDW